MTHQVIVIRSTEDEAQERMLHTHLSAAKAKGLVVLRSLSDFRGEAEMESALDEADIVFVLLTPALVNSPLWTGVALQRAKANRERLGIPAVPVLVQKCVLAGSWLEGIAGLPRAGRPIQEHSRGALDGWVEVAQEIQRLLTDRAPRRKNVGVEKAEEVDSGVASALGDLSGVEQAYRMLAHYHEAVLRLVDAAERATEQALGPLGERSWSPGELYFPGRSVNSTGDAGCRHIPLQRVSYFWSTAYWPRTDNGRVVLVHDGDGGAEAIKGGERARGSGGRPRMYLFAVFVARLRAEVRPGLTWGDIERGIAAARGVSAESWGDGSVHVAETSDGVVRFGGFSCDVVECLSPAQREVWANRVRTLCAGVKGSENR